MLDTIVFLDGNGELRKGADDVITNLLLLDGEVIDAFIVKWIDYTDFHTFDEVIDLIKERSQDKEWSDKYIMWPTRKGIIVTTYNNWIIGVLSSTMKKNLDEYMVSTITDQELTYVLAPGTLYEEYDNFESAVNEDNKYQLYVRIGDHNAILLRELNDISVAVKTLQLFSEAIPSYTFSIRYEDEDIHNTTIFKETCESLIDKSIDLEEYIDEVSAENERLYSNPKLIYMLLFTKCQT